MKKIIKCPYCKGEDIGLSLIETEDYYCCQCRLSFKENEKYSDKNVAKLVRDIKKMYGNDIFNISKIILKKFNYKDDMLLQRELIKQGYTIETIRCNQILDILL